MSTTLLFCIADEAKELAITTTQPIEIDDGLEAIPWFRLVTTRIGPPIEDGMFCEVYDASGEWQNEWNGASEHDCQKWAFDRKEAGDRSIEPHVILIADERSSHDETLLIQVYVYDPPQYCQESPDSEIFGPESKKWYSFRIPHQSAKDTLVDFSEGDPPLVNVIYFAAIADFTKQNGILDTDKVRRFMTGDEHIEMDNHGNISYPEKPVNHRGD